jgi:hypothetical protein
MLFWLELNSDSLLAGQFSAGMRPRSRFCEVSLRRNAVAPPPSRALEFRRSWLARSRVAIPADCVGRIVCSTVAAVRRPAVRCDLASGPRLRDPLWSALSPVCLECREAFIGDLEDRPAQLARADPDHERARRAPGRRANQRAPLRAPSGGARQHDADVQRAHPTVLPVQRRERTRLLLTRAVVVSRR